MREDSCPSASLCQVQHRSGQPVWRRKLRFANSVGRARPTGRKPAHRTRVGDEAGFLTTTRPRRYFVHWTAIACRCIEDAKVE